MTKTYEELQAQLDECLEENFALHTAKSELHTKLDARRTECHELYLLNHGLRTQNEELRVRLLESSKRTNQAAIAAATYKEGVHHAS